jgi:hypothetical protein
LIATSQPQDVINIVEGYKEDLERIEANLMDLILVSGGATTWTELMSMPLPSVRILTNQLNKQTEERNQAMQKKSTRR